MTRKPEKHNKNNAVNRRDSIKQTTNLSTPFTLCLQRTQLFEYSQNGHNTKYINSYILTEINFKMCIQNDVLKAYNVM